MLTRCERGATLFLDFLAPRLHAPFTSSSRTARPGRGCAGPSGRAVLQCRRASSSSAVAAHVLTKNVDAPHTKPSESGDRQPSPQAQPQQLPSQRPTKLSEIHGDYSHNVPLRMAYSRDILSRQTGTDTSPEDVPPPATAGERIGKRKRAKLGPARAVVGFDRWHSGRSISESRSQAQQSPQSSTAENGAQGVDGEEIEDPETREKLNELRLILLEEKLPPDFLLRLRPLVHALTPRDVADITRFLCSPSRLEGAFPNPSGIPWPEGSGKEGDMPPEEVELEIAIHCLSASPHKHAQALRAVMLRHVKHLPASEAMVQRCWDELVRVRTTSGRADRLAGHNVGELVTIYIALLAQRAVNTYKTHDGELRPLPASVQIPFFREALELGVRIGRSSRGGPGAENRSRPGQPLSPSLARSLFSPYLSEPVLGTLLNWLGAIQYARLAADGKKLYLYIDMLTRNRRTAEVWELWLRTEEGVKGGWAVFKGAQKGDGEGLKFWDERQKVGFETLLEEEQGAAVDERQRGQKEREEEEEEEDEEDEEGYEEDRAGQEDAAGHVDNLQSELHNVESKLQNIEHGGSQDSAGISEATTSTVTATAREKRTPRSVIPIQIVTPVQTILLSAFLILHRPDLTSMILDRIMESKIQLTTHHFSALLSGFAKRSSWAEAHSVWVMMEAQGVERDRASWNAWLQALFGSRLWKDGMREFAKMREAFPEPGVPKHGENSTTVKVPPTSITPEEKEERGVGQRVYNTVLHGLFANDRVDEARKLWGEMRRVGMIDVVSYNTVLKFQARKADWTGIARSLRGLKDDGISPDAYTFTTILEAVAARPAGPGRLGVTKGEARLDSVREGVHLVWDTMREHGVKPNGVMIGKIVDVMVNGGREENIRAAIALLQEIDEAEGAELLFPPSIGAGADTAWTSQMAKDLPTQEGSSRLNEITYTACIVGIMRSSLSIHDKRGLIAQLLQRMRARNIGANRVTYHVLLRCCFDSQAPAEAMSLWREQRALGLASKDTWYLLVKGLNQIPADFDSARHPRASTVSQYLPDDAPLSPLGEWKVPDGTREEWVREVAKAMEEDGVPLTGQLRSAWNRLMSSRFLYYD